MNVSEAGTQAIVMNLRSEGQTSRADYVEALWQALLVAWNDTGEYTRQYSELQEATNSLTAELAAARELLREAQDRLLKQDAYIALLEGRE